MPGRLKSAVVTWPTGAPNASSAFTMLAALAGVGSTHTSKSPVARGRPCTASAYAPTTRNRTSAARKARNRSTKSGFMRRLAPKRPLLLAQSPREQHSLRVRKASPELDVVPIRISVAREPAHGQLRRARLMLVLVGHSPIIAHREN